MRGGAIVAFAAAASAALAAVLAALLATGAAAAAPPLAADLSSREIAINTGFAGAELLLFGATEGAGDIVVVVRGPRRREIVRRKVRVAGVWVNGDAVAFDRVPAYYRIASTRPLAEIAPPSLLRAREFGAQRLVVLPVGVTPHPELAAFRDALVRNKRRSGLYGERPGRIDIVDERLFRTTVSFPANVPTGTYSVEVYLLRNGAIAGSKTTPLAVHKVGLEAEIFNFAHQRSALYGAIAIAIAAVAGWAAGVIFRRS